MKKLTSLPSRTICPTRIFSIACAAILCTKLLMSGLPAFAEDTPGTAGEPYPKMPEIAPLGVRIGKHLEVPESSKGPAIDPGKGYRLQDLGEGLYMVTDNIYQSMFMVYSKGV